MPEKKKKKDQEEEKFSVKITGTENPAQEGKRQNGNFPLSGATASLLKGQ